MLGDRAEPLINHRLHYITPDQPFKCSRCLDKAVCTSQTSNPRPLPLDAPCPSLCACVCAQDNVALIAVLEMLPDPERPGAPKQLLCVANTHIHANPELSDVKLWQVHTLLKGLEKIANRCAAILQLLPQLWVCCFPHLFACPLFPPLLIRVFPPFLSLIICLPHSALSFHPFRVAAPTSPCWSLVTSTACLAALHTHCWSRDVWSQGSW